MAQHRPVIADLDGLPDAQYMNFHEAGDRRKDAFGTRGHYWRTESVGWPRIEVCQAIASRRLGHAPPPQLVGEEVCPRPVCDVPIEIPPSSKRFRDRSEHYLRRLLNSPCT
jgi:hypothetical protein